MKAADRDAAVWKALADPTRREILDRLRLEPMRTGDLAAGFAMTRFGVRKHLQVLAEAGLVLTENRGRERWLRINPVPIQAIGERWIRSFEVPAARSALRIRQLAETPDPPRAMSESTACEVRHVVVEIPIEAPRERVWDALVNRTAEWWHPDFYTGPAPLAFHIEPMLGGKMYEDWGDGNGQIWGHVVGMRSPEFLQFMGDSSRDWGGPSRNVMTMLLEESGGTTTLRMENSVFGHISEATAASLDQGWKLLFGEGLKPFVEGLATG